MRQFKFRVWALGKMTPWEEIAIEFKFDTTKGNDFFHLKEYFDYIEAQEFIIMQFVGHQDLNGKDIYEGDICRQHWNGHVIIAPMVYNNGKSQFGLAAEVDFDPGTDHVEIALPRNTLPEVIGNIYENPELLEAKS